MAILNNSNAISTSGAYNLNNSLRLRASATAYLTRTQGNGSATSFTASMWVKRGLLATGHILNSGSAGASEGWIRFASDTISFQDGTNASEIATTAVYRDPSAWYHIVVSVNTANATSADRVIIYVNNVRQAVTGSHTGSNLLSWNKTGEVLAIGRFTRSASNYLDGYLAEVNFIDGQQLTPSSFGSTDTTTGQWLPKAYTSTYGTNGFYQKYSDIAQTVSSNVGLGKDFSGNTNYFVTNNISTTAGSTYDAMIDVPTLTSETIANYAVLNPLSKGTNASITNANLAVSYGAVAWTSAFATMGVSTGKWYWEATLTSAGNDCGVGISSNPAGSANSYPGSDANSWSYVGANGQKWTNGSGATYGATYSNGDVIGVALNLDAGTLTFYKNNTSQGTAFSSLASNTYFPALGVNSSSFVINFGQRPFSYTPPTGFKALNTYNLPDSTIKKGNTVMDATTYTGTGASLSVTNAGAFKPDLVWVKGRSGATDHALYDSVRGTTKQLESNTTDAETTEATGLTAFGTSGFTVGALAQMNTSAATYIGWQWQAGQGSSSSNTSGTITSTVSVNATAGFSIATYTGNGSTGATFGHGLGVAPSMVIIKKRSTTGNWITYHTSTGINQYLYLNSTATSATATPTWGVSSTLITLQQSFGDYNTSATTYVAYCWAEIAGFSKFGSYIGNGSTDGTFVYTGFRPKFIMWKSSSAAYNWNIIDTSRNTYNVADAILRPNTSDAEVVGGSGAGVFDILSNGFKLRTGTAGWNDANTYIYAAFAENPFKNSNAR
jgi:hypothetical protein